MGWSNSTDMLYICMYIDDDTAVVQKIAEQMITSCLQFPSWCLMSGSLD